MQFVKTLLSKLNSFLFDKGERYYPVESFDKLNPTHTTNYIFAAKFIGGGKLVLDEGCGCGFGCKYLSENGAKFVVGIDRSKGAIRFAKSRYSGDNLDFAVMDVCNLAFQNDVFEVVSSFEVIEHLPEVKHYLFEMYRVLNTNGISVISTPNKKSSSPSLKKPIIPFHIKEFYPDELCFLLSRVFKNVSMFGKRISNKDMVTKEQEFRQSMRFMLISKLSQYEPIRILARVFPLSLKQILTMNKELHLNTNDFVISSTHVNDSPHLIAICGK